jgi:hypothetical protein
MNGEYLSNPNDIIVSIFILGCIVWGVFMLVSSQIKYRDYIIKRKKNNKKM